MNARTISNAILVVLTLLIFNPSFANDNADSSINSSTSSTININNASLEQLEKVKGIGSKKAQAIIDYRLKNGAFTEVEELTKVKGIGDKFIAKNRMLLATE